MDLPSPNEPNSLGKGLVKPNSLGRGGGRQDGKEGVQNEEHSTAFLVML